MRHRTSQLPNNEFHYDMIQMHCQKIVSNLNLKKISISDIWDIGYYVASELNIVIVDGLDHQQRSNIDSWILPVEAESESYPIVLMFLPAAEI